MAKALTHRNPEHRPGDRTLGGQSSHLSQPNASPWGQDPQTTDQNPKPSPITAQSIAMGTVHPEAKALTHRNPEHRPGDRTLGGQSFHLSQPNASPWGQAPQTTDQNPKPSPIVAQRITMGTVHPEAKALTHRNPEHRRGDRTPKTQSPHPPQPSASPWGQDPQTTDQNPKPSPIVAQRITMGTVHPEAKALTHRNPEHRRGDRTPKTQSPHPPQPSASPWGQDTRRPKASPIVAQGNALGTRRQKTQSPERADQIPTPCPPKIARHFRTPKQEGLGMPQVHFPANGTNECSPGQRSGFMIA
jgi:hypothetical protein